MIAKVSNQNFGWCVACDGNWAVVGNPNPFRFDPATQSLQRSGSIEVYRYNINTDVHDVRTILHRQLTKDDDLLLTTEDNNTPPEGPDYYLHTEYTGSIPYTSDMDLLVDVGNYFTSSEDAYGLCLDVTNNILAVGSPYRYDTFTFTNSTITSSGDGFVDLFDLSTLDIDPYAVRTPPTILGYNTLPNGFISVNISVPAAQNYSYVIFQSKDTDLNSNWVSVAAGPTSNGGGNITVETFYTGSFTGSLSGFEKRTVGIVGTDPFLLRIYNPDLNVSESFGTSVSLNDEWLAVGSALESGSRGSVFMYRKIAKNNLSWSLIQTLPVPDDIVVGDNFGFDIALNKASSSFSWSMVVGSVKPSSSKAYIYEFDGNSWNNTFTLLPDNTTIYPLPFYPTLPIVQNYPNTADSFGYSVSMYENTVMVGAPNDRLIYEYTGSSLYKQGAVYFFERCPNKDYGYYITRKSYGNEKIITNNMLGASVSIFGKYAVAGAPKIDALSSSVCYLRGSLFQEHYCNQNEASALCGQYVLYNRTTSSIAEAANVDWDITNIYQVKKRLLSPYRVYGWDSCVCDRFITIGAPMLVSGSSVDMDLNMMTGSFTGSVYDLGDLSGKSYIYNLRNLREQFYAGNVFYRNGKIIIMTSGSNFEGLQFNNVVSDEYQYEIDFKSKQTVFEKQVVCPVEPGEFNVSTNPTAVVFPNSDFDINNNGTFDFQDVDVLLKYMAFKATEFTTAPSFDWTSSILNTTTDEETSVYNMYSSSWSGTDSLFSSSYSNINNTLFNDLDFNEDNKINYNDMSILWKYFICRLTQKNYESYITPNSQKKYLSDILDYMNSKTLRGQPPTINQNFLDYTRFSKQDPTGSYLAPTVTAIGLYDGTDLVAVAKLGSPIKITPDFPINFVVKMDF